MGTSSRYNGPTGNNPLIPNGYIPENDNIPNKDEINKKKIKEKEDKEKWKNAKSNMTRCLNRKMSEKKAIKSYVKALGGAKKAASKSVSAKNATIVLGNFLSNISKNGIGNYLNNNNIEYKNRNIEDVLSDVANILSPSGDTKENSIVREAMFNIIGELYDEINENNGDIEDLNNFTTENFSEIMNNFISEVIFQKLMNDLGSREEISNQETSQLMKIENEIKLYISNIVDITLSQEKYDEFNYSNTEINEIVERLYTNCYKSLEEGIL